MPKQKIQKRSTKRKTTKKRPVSKKETPVFSVLKNKQDTDALNQEQINPISGREPITEKKIAIITTSNIPISPYTINFKPENQEKPNEAVAPNPFIALKRKALSAKIENLQPTSQTNDEADGQELTQIATPTIKAPVITPPKHRRAVHLPKFNLPKINFDYLKSIRLPHISSQKPHTVTKVTKIDREQVRKIVYTKKDNIKNRSAGFELPFKLIFDAKSLRSAASFAAMAFIFILPAAGLAGFDRAQHIKTNLEKRGQMAMSALNENAQNLFSVDGLNQVTQLFADTKDNLEKTIGIFDKLLPLIPKTGETYASGKFLLDAGSHLSETARIVTGGFNSFTSNETPLTNRLVSIEDTLRQALPILHAGVIELNNIKENSLPSEIEKTISQIRDLTNSVYQSLARVIDVLPALENFLGLERPKSYLVIFQNNNEIRPTGGFIGSFALLNIDRGQITSIEIPGGGSYDLRGGLLKHVIAPQPLHLIEPHWQFHDANWFPDFSTSAKKLIWFYEKSGGPTVDGVIALNATLIPKLLEITGPITMPEYNRTFDANNFIEETQKIVELEYDRVENKPKKLIGALTPKLLEKLLQAPSEQLVKILTVFGESLQNKDIQLYSEDEQTESSFSKIGWTGEMHATSGDYLMAVNSNIAGGKTNGVIDTSIKHKTEIGDDGSIIDNVEITQTHGGNKGDLFSGVRSVNYLRIYVPIGSELIDAEGFEEPPRELFSLPDPDYTLDEDLSRIVTNEWLDPNSKTDVSEEMGKTVFGNWVQIDPGQTKAVRFTYKLPWRLNLSDDSFANNFKSALGLPEFNTYSLIVDKQSGLESDFNSTITFPTKFKVRWNTEGVFSPGRFETHKILDRVLFTAILFENIN